MRVEDQIRQITTRKIKLNEGKFALVDADLFRWINLLKWKAVFSGTRWYARAWVPSLDKEAFMHRLVLDAGPETIVDHKNGDGLDNRRTNLRFATRSQNGINRKPQGKSSRFKGVSFDKVSKKWFARVYVNGRSKIVGMFKNEADAAEAFNEAAKAAHGEFAWLNPVNPGDPLMRFKSDKIPNPWRGPGRIPKPWRRQSMAGAPWYSTVRGRKVYLAPGNATEEVAAARLTEILAALMALVDGAV